MDSDSESPEPTSSRKSGTGATEADELVRDALVHKVRENIEPFLDTFFDIQPQECDAMLQKLADRSLWSLKTTSWTNLPSHPENEMSLFSPLVEIANAVAELDYAIHPRSDGAILSWIDAHNEGVDSYWSGTYDGFVDLIAELEPVTPACTSFRSRCHKSLSWNRVIIPGIIKERGISYSGVIQLQLFHCVRQMYKEQPDRRFIFGFTFEFVFLTVWYFDRTGVLGSERINVHKSPLRFIQFLLGCARMHAVDLGFDPTFLWFKDEHTHLPSYRIPPWIVKGGFDALPWIFEMPENSRETTKTTRQAKGKTIPKREGGIPAKDVPRRRKKFVTFRAIKVNRSEMIIGRATRVWLAYSLKDFLKALEPPDVTPLNASMSRVFVLKDTWHDISRVAEGCLYRKQGRLDGVATFYSSERVKVSGKVDTIRRARKDMKIVGRRVCLTKEYPPHQALPANYSHPTSSLSEDELLQWIDILRRDKTAPRGIKEVNRAHYRVLLYSFGYPITDFLSQEELLVAFNDAIKGHKRMFDAGYLHRDISSGNVLITDQPSPNRGILIDQDFTIPADSPYESSRGDPCIGTQPFVATEMINHASYIPLTDRDLYARQMTNEFGLPVSPKREVRYRAIHDLESFFWVLCWICVMWDGPSTRRSITEDDNPDGFDSTDTLFCKTDPDAGGTVKRMIIGEDSQFSRVIIEYLSPFFYSMGPLLSRLREILYNAYCNSEFESLHEAFTEAIEHRIGELKTRPDPTQYPQDVAKARRRVERLMKIPRRTRALRLEEVSLEEQSRIEESIAQTVAVILQEKETRFKEMVNLAKQRRENCRFQLPPQFRDGSSVNSERSLPGPSDEEDRDYKKARIS